MTFTITIGLNTYPAYGDLTDVAVYLGGRRGTAAFDALTATEQGKCVVSATRWIDRQKWLGEKVDADQDLEFVYRSDLVDKDGNDVPEDELAPGVFEAMCEMALQIAADDAAAEALDGGSNVREAHAGSAGVTFFRPVEAGRFGTIVQELLGSYLSSGSGLPGVEASGNSCGERSTFDDCGGAGRFGINQGLS